MRTFFATLIVAAPFIALAIALDIILGSQGI